jgi:UDP-N-acetylmuramate dehydrogenase
MKIIHDADLTNYNSYRLGGIAKSLTIIEDLKDFDYLNRDILKQAQIIGGGTNILLSSKGIYKDFIKIDNKGYEVNNEITIQAGSNLTGTFTELAKLGYRDFLFAIGIPGTVGGAIVMNSGTNISISDIITSVTIMTRDYEIKTLPVSDIQYAYRSSIFQSNDWIVLSATFKTNKTEPVTDEEITNITKDRFNKHPLSFPSAGCWFKGAYGCSDIIREIGLSGQWRDGAVSSPLFPAFILNVNSSAQSIYTFVKEIQTKAESINKPLLLEVKLIGDFV